MKFRVLIVIVLVMIAGPVFAQQIHIDYDQDYDGSGIKTFAWAETSKTSVAEANPLLHSRILNGIEYYLTLGGAREVENNPDVYVTYHASTRDQVVLNTTSWGYGYPGGWGYYGGRSYHHSGVPSTTTVSTYERGTLVVDVWDAETKQLRLGYLVNNDKSVISTRRKEVPEGDSATFHAPIPEFGVAVMDMLEIDNLDELNTSSENAYALKY